MDKLFQNILCPVDIDDLSAAALDFVRTVAQQTGAKVCVIHVASVDQKVDRASEKGAIVQLGELVAERLAGKIDYQLVLRTGHIATEVLSAVKEFGSDLIVIPTHGRAGLKRFVLGSVAEHVIRESTVPVLVMRAPASD
jgi:nucleotide-binding universal stress UspA family protein